MSRVLVIGESLVDVVRTAGTEARHAGGSPMNVAYGLAQLGVLVDLLTRMGFDADGGLIASHLSKAGVRVLPASLREQPTSTAIATIAKSSRVTSQTWTICRFPPLVRFATVVMGSLSC